MPGGVVSAETKAALDTALAAHVADELDDAIIIAYVCQAAAMTGDDFDAEQTQYLRMVAEGQSAHVTLGILDYAHSRYRAAMIEDD